MSNVITESNICRNTSDELKKITQRNVVLNETIERSDIGAFLLLDVEKLNEKVELSRESSKIEINSNFKISHMLYEMSPRSWKPSSSLALNSNKLEAKFPTKT